METIKSDLSHCINIGKDTENKLKQVGIDSFDKLRSVGSKQAFLLLQTIDPGACLSLLYGLEGAIEGIKWHKLPARRKQTLIEFYNLAKRELRTSSAM